MNLGFSLHFSKVHKSSSIGLPALAASPTMNFGPSRTVWLKGGLVHSGSIIACADRPMKTQIPSFFSSRGF